MDRSNGLLLTNTVFIDKNNIIGHMTNNIG